MKTGVVHAIATNRPTEGIYVYLSAIAYVEICTTPSTGTREITYQNHPTARQGRCFRHRIATAVIVSKINREPMTCHAGIDVGKG